MDQGFLAVEADASNEDVLRRVRIDRARGFVAAVSTDAENVYAVLSARLLKPDLFIVGRAESEDARTKLKRAGADRVISPYHLGGLQLAQTALRPAVVDFVQLATSLREHGSEPGAGAHRGRLAARRPQPVDAGLRQRFGVVVVGIRRADGKMDFNPAPETAMHAGDDLVVLGRGGKPQGAEDCGRARCDASATTRCERTTACSERDCMLTERRSRPTIRAAAMPGVQAFTARAGPAAGARASSWSARIPASEVYVRNKVKAGTDAGLVGRSAAAAGDRVARRAAARSSIG